jgi:hypothetical protein
LFVSRTRSRQRMVAAVGTCSRAASTAAEPLKRRGMERSGVAGAEMNRPLKPSTEIAYVVGPFAVPITRDSQRSRNTLRHADDHSQR